MVLKEKEFQSFNEEAKKFRSAEEFARKQLKIRNLASVEGYSMRGVVEQLVDFWNKVNKMNIDEKAKALVHYIGALKNFKIVNEIDGNYDHIGATITDAILQAGIKYDSVVKPRVSGLRNKYSYEKTTSKFLRIIEEVGVDKLLNWKKDDAKLRCILSVAKFFKEEGIETEKELRQWLRIKNNVMKLKKLKGIKDKTVDYFKILVGIKTSAIDRHLFNFIHEAKIEVNKYFEAQMIINKAAQIMKINAAYLDHSIWKYMSNKKGLNKKNYFL